MNTFNKQLHIGSDEPAADLMQPIIQDMHAPLYKARGGIWTSTYINYEHGSDWTQYLISICDHADEADFQKSWIMTPAQDAKIFIVDSYKDLEDLLRAYGKPYYEGSDRITPDYIELMKDFDALHLTEKGQTETRLSMPHSLYGWDCESTFWLRWKFEKVEFIGEIKYKNIYEY